MWFQYRAKLTIVYVAADVHLELIRICSDRVNARVNFVLIKKYFTLVGLSKLNSIMFSISKVFDVKAWRRPTRRERCRQISTFRVFRGLQVNHLTLESISMSSRGKFVVSDRLIFRETKYLRDFPTKYEV